MSKKVFINCPFDNAFSPILQGIAFVVILCGFEPTLALQSSDSSETRIAKIIKLIKESNYSIHDLSRVRAEKKGDYFRLNMPFELGIDYATLAYNTSKKGKKLLIFEGKAHEAKPALSDLSGCDFYQHNNRYDKAMKQVLYWLIQEAKIESVGYANVEQKYTDFQEWHFEKMISEGHSQEEIREYPTALVLKSMNEWSEVGQPSSYN